MCLPRLFLSLKLSAPEKKTATICLARCTGNQRYSICKHATTPTWPMLRLYCKLYALPLIVCMLARAQNEYNRAHPQRSPLAIVLCRDWVGGAWSRLTYGRSPRHPSVRNDGTASSGLSCAEPDDDDDIASKSKWYGYAFHEQRSTWMSALASAFVC